MEVYRTIDEVRRGRRRLGGRLALIPTMGYLHRGHVALIEEGLRKAEHAAVSVYVNPTQFGPGEDLESYPRDLEGDLQTCREAGCDLVFLPDDRQMYPSGFATTVRVGGGLGDWLCGPSRPEHFDGVTTVVSKLLHIVEPQLGVFGQKDYQQLAIVRRMVRDLNIDVEIVGVPTVREADGLAMSSRNRYLQGPPPPAGPVAVAGAARRPLPLTRLVCATLTGYASWRGHAWSQAAPRSV